MVALAPVLVEYSAISQELEKWTGPAIDDMRGQLAFFLPAHAITVHGMAYLRHVPRYIDAMRIRLEDMAIDPDRDADRQDVVAATHAYLNAKLRTLPAGREKTKDVKDILWRIQELRVSLFAQRLGTPKPVSQRRIEKLIDAVR